MTGNPSLGLRQAHKCDRVKPVNGRNVKILNVAISKYF